MTGGACWGAATPGLPSVWLDTTKTCWPPGSALATPWGAAVEGVERLLLAGVTALLPLWNGQVNRWPGARG